MRFEVLYTDKELVGRCGDTVTVCDKSYLVVGHTNFGENLLIRAQDSFQIFKLQFKAKSSP